MDQRRVIAALDIHVRLLADAVVDDDFEIVALAHGRHRAEHTVREQAPDLVLAGEIDAVADLAFEILQAEMARGRQDREQVATVAPQHDGLGEALARDVTRLGGARRRHRRVVRDHLIGDGAVEMPLERRSDRHVGLHALAASELAEKASWLQAIPGRA